MSEEKEYSSRGFSELSIEIQQLRRAIAEAAQERLRPTIINLDSLAEVDKALVKAHRLLREVGK